MKSSSKHAIAQRLLGAIGLLLFVGPLWFQSFGFISFPIQIFGLLILFFAILSAFGVGQWGHYYSSICVLEREEENKKLVSKQPWQ